MMEPGPREHHAVEQRRREARRRAAGDFPEKPVRAGAVEIHGTPDAGVHRRQDTRRAVDHRRHVTDQGLVQDGLHGGALVRSALGVPLEDGPGCHGELGVLERFFHGPEHGCILVYSEVPVQRI